MTTYLAILESERLDKLKTHKCNSCGMKCKPAYVKPYLCEDCAIEIYEGKQ